MSDTPNETPPEEQTDTPPEETPNEATPAEGETTTGEPQPADGTTEGSTDGGTEAEGSTTDPSVPANEVSDPLPEGQEAGASDVQSLLDEEQEQGFRGEPADETPNHAYTVAGVLANEETPESKASTPV